MKKFSFIVVDDQNITQKEGAKRIFKHFLLGKYIRESKDFGGMFNEEGFSNENLEVGFYILCSNICIYKISFSQALEILEEEQDKYDFYIFDLKFDSGSMDPRHEKNKNEHRACYKMIPIEELHENKGVKSIFVAGLEFLNVISDTYKPKYFCSAASETITLRNSIRLFESRLSDIYLLSMGDIEKEKLPDHVIESQKLFEKSLDSYLAERQRKVINMQINEKIFELIKILESDDASKYDEPSIPDDGIVSEDKENYWSLHTLFPKQINAIISGNQKLENKDYILDHLRIDWQKLVKCIYSHFEGIGDGFKISEYAETGKSDLYEKVRAYDFEKGYKSNSYVQFSEIIDKINNKYKTDNLKIIDCTYRDELIGSQRGIIPYNKTPLNYFVNLKEQQKKLIETDDDFKKEISSLPKFPELSNITAVSHKLITLGEKYGISTNDLKYLNEINFHNTRHYTYNGNKNHNLCYFAIDQDEANMSCELLWYYKLINENKINDYFAGIKYDIKKVVNDNDWLVLDDNGISDIIKIACYRYKGLFEFYTREFYIFHDGNKLNVINEKITNHKYPGIPDTISCMKITIKEP